jgi:hypothetical protein
MELRNPAERGRERIFATGVIRQALRYVLLWQHIIAMKFFPVVRAASWEYF